MPTWLFQGNPDIFDVDGYLEAQDVITWLVNQRSPAHQMQIGDDVFIWRSSGKKRNESGVIAHAQIIQPPAMRSEDQAGIPFWKTPVDESERLRVELQIIRRAKGKEIIQRAWCAEDPILSDLLILRFANQTNYLLSEEHATRLRALWKNTGRTWNRAESVAGLWAYHNTYGQPVSKSQDSTVAKVAVRIGRALTGVYNKVMNFRSLDPRDDRQGLSGAGESDRAVWAEFYDPGSRQLATDRLETEFARLWGSLSQSSEKEVDIDALEDHSKTPLSGVASKQQGRIADPLVRRAVERRAVAIAKDHYEKAGYEVEDTGNTESFDLRCKAQGEELRVEVKGTTGRGETVQLTANEVSHARSRITRVDLFIVSGIEVLRSPEGPQAIGGMPRQLENWIPADEDLQPSAYVYSVPGTSTKSGLETKENG